MSWFSGSTPALTKSDQARAAADAWDAKRKIAVDAMIPLAIDAIDKLIIKAASESGLRSVRFNVGELSPVAAMTPALTASELAQLLEAIIEFVEKEKFRTRHFGQSKNFEISWDEDEESNEESSSEEDYSSEDDESSEESSEDDSETIEDSSSEISSSTDSEDY